MGSERISVVIPYHNESKTVRTTLELASRQTLAPHEVLLVDSNSTDSSFECIQEWISSNQAKFSIHFRNVHRGTGVPSSSKNVGIILAESGLVAFMDCGILFERDWLEKQYDFLQRHALRVVSGTCCFTGVGVFDKSAIAQTYGYRRTRPTVPSTLVRKSVFDATGYFQEGQRAGYDVDWIQQLRKHKIVRGINPDVVIRYNGLNYASSSKQLLLKTISYTAPTVRTYNYFIPYYYLGICLLSLILLGVRPSWVPQALLAYFLLRGYVVPCLKSQGIRLVTEHPSSLLVLPLVGLVIDIGKMIGYFKGMALVLSLEKEQKAPSLL